MTLDADIYLVGGAVRDRLLGLDPIEQDWVVVGASHQMMIAAGYKNVGADFPVYLHPKSGDEYALARTERKTAPGYHGFQFNADAQVTLVEDLGRRDLTINAIAESATGEIIDPHGGLKDLKNKLLRHVSPAFSEDPVRILRIARFAARYVHLGFTIAPETRVLMKAMVAEGEVDSLVAERSWQEFHKSLNDGAPWVFIQVLRDCGALHRIAPEVDRLFGVPQNKVHHPEIDTGVHVLMALEMACRLSDEPIVRFATLLHDLGKGVTDKKHWPKHPGHEAAGLPLVQEICKRLNVPKKFRQLAELACLHHLDCHRSNELSAQQLGELFKRLDALRSPERFEQFLLVCEADARGCLGKFDSVYLQRPFMQSAIQSFRAVDIQPICQSGLKGRELAQGIEQLRIAALEPHVCYD